MSCHRALPGLMLPVGLAALLAAGCGDVTANPDGAPAPDAGADAAPDADVQPVVSCEPAGPRPDDGICDVTPGTGTATVVRGTVLGPDQVYEDGSVLYDGDEIVCVGCDCSEADGFADATRIDCGTAVVSPALINPHDHLTFTEGHPIDLGTTRYDHRHGWRGSLSTPSNPHGTGDTGAGNRWGEVRMVMGGAATLVGSGRALGMMRNLDRLTAEERNRGFREIEFETFPLGDANETFRPNCTWNYRETELSVASYASYLPHVAEGIDVYAAEEFRCQSSSFDGARDFTEANTAHIHGIGLTAEGYTRMAMDRAQIIWSPRSNIALYGMTAQVDLFHRLGGTLALGTDWTYSGSVNMLRELACADEFNTGYLDGYFSDRQLWEMATLGAALTTDSADLIGSLEPGKVADISVFAAAEGVHHRAVLEAGNEEVALVIKAGRALYGEADILAGLGEDCEAVDVCGLQRAICAAREFSGTDYDSLAETVSTGNAAYPAFFCGVPDGEPTCVPSRPGEYTGVATADDSDGDGIPDETDNCPRVFNPIRPMDDGNQPDADGDGVGDACDPAPLGDDHDGDEVANDDDNCPFTNNPDQHDADEDGKGDACDPCPEMPNPDGVCPPAVVTISDIQTGAIPVGTPVTVTDVVVTGVRSNAAAVQDPNAAEPAWSGIYVFTGSSPGVEIGDEVMVAGQVEEYFELTEISGATITKTGTGTIAPTSLTVAEAATEDYEGVLVTLTDAEVTDPAYDCSVDGPQCGDAGLWELSEAIIVWDNFFSGGSWNDLVGTLPVTGVMHYRFDRRRIMPRSPADFGE